MPKEDNLYYEYKAILTLQTLFKRRYPNKIEKTESPDWIDGTNNIGIEVTRSFYEGQGELTGLHKKFSNSLINKKIKNTFKLNNAKLFMKNEKYYGFLRVLWVTSKHLKDSFNAKIESINKEHYKICKQYDLYICTQNLHDFEQEEISLLLDYFIQTQKSYKRKFKYVYIDDSPNFYELDLLQHSLQKFILDENVISNIQLKVKNLIKISI